MNILFLSLLDFNTFDERNIYSDLLREFIKNGHRIYCISPVEKRMQQDSQLLQFEESYILRLKIGNIQKVNMIEKGISTLTIERLFIKGLKKYFPNVKFELVLYATPPVTFEKVVCFVKKRDNASSYLMLKDIFPQNAVDLGMLAKTGPKGLLYRYFRKKEKRLYAVSDRIGCMSQANVDYILKKNLEISPEKVEICPNCLEFRDLRISPQECLEIRDRYGIPKNKKVFVYGGNLGKPQDVPFIVRCLKACAGMEDIFFVVAGGGTDKNLLQEYVDTECPSHVKLLGQLPKEEYDQMVACCDIGLIFLDPRFTIPNFPSRLLSYMQAGLPVLACTDSNTDVGKVIVEGGFGWQCESREVASFVRTAKEASCADVTEMKNSAISCLRERYAADRAYAIIVQAI